MSVVYEAVIGLEVHVQLLTRSKLFCGCSTEFGGEPNSHVCPVCVGLPGALPVPNAEAIDMAMRAALALDCEVRQGSRFARKNYFYPDLAKGYQISQFELPLNENGRLRIQSGETERDVFITRIHVEEDAAKNIHGAGSSSETLVDFNRAGVALIEIVGEPDLRSSDEAESYLRRLREILMFIGVNDGNLEEGSFRCDANVSIRPRGQEALGTRTELKNINSFRFVKKAIDHEIQRQELELSAGRPIVQETRTWNEGKARTVSMRSKEEAHDYRYFPDPDLPPLMIDEERLAELRRAAPELPEACRLRWQRVLGLTPYDAQVLSTHPAVAAYFEQTAEGLSKGAGLALVEAGKRAGNFVQSEVLRDVKLEGLQAEFPVSAAALAELLSVVSRGTISGKMAKDVLAEMAKSGEGAAAVIEREGLAQVSDVAAIEDVVRQVLDGHASQVQQYRDGNKKVLGFFVGQVMKATKGSANPAMANQILRKLLEGA